MVRLVEDDGKDLLHPSHLPAYSFLLIGGPTPPDARVVVGVPIGHVEQGVANAFDALPAQHLDETGDALALYLL